MGFTKKSKILRNRLFRTALRGHDECDTCDMAKQVCISVKVARPSMLQKNLLGGAVYDDDDDDDDNNGRVTRKGRSA